MIKLLLGPAFPWILLALVLAIGGAGTSGYVRGRADGRAALEAQIAREAVITQEAQDKALDAAATKVAAITVTNRTIRAKTEVITREVPVYTNCSHAPDGLRLVNEALRPPGESAPESELPGPDAARR